MIITTSFLVICQEKKGPVLKRYGGKESLLSKIWKVTSPIRRWKIQVTANWPIEMNELKCINDPTLCDVEGPIWLTSSPKADWASVDLLPVLWKKCGEWLWTFPFVLIRNSSHNGDVKVKQKNKQTNKTKNKTIGFNINKQNMRRPLNYHGFVCRLKFFFT